MRTRPGPAPLAPVFTVLTAQDADGGLRLSVRGDVTESCLDLRDVVLAALKSEPPRVEVELSGVGDLDAEAAAFLLACGRMARLLGIEYRLTRVADHAAEVLGACAGEDDPGWAAWAQRQQTPTPL